MSEPRCIRLSGRAARYLLLLQDLGHLDAESADRLLIQLGEDADLHGASGPPVVDIDAVRRAAALLLAAAEDPPPLQADWPLLFT